MTETTKEPQKRYKQVGIIAMRNTATGEFEEAVPMYIAEDVCDTVAADIVDGLSISKPFRDMVLAWGEKQER